MRQARALVPADAAFAGMKVEYVGARGLIDLKAPTYKARVLYTFLGPEQAPPQSSAPLGAPRPAAPAPERYVVLLDREGLRIAAEAVAFPKRLPDPKCTLAEVWAAAKAAGAPADAVAKITFEAPLTGALRWAFEIQGVGHRTYVSNETCRQVSSLF